MTSGTEKLECFGYRTVKHINFEDTISCFDKIHERDRRTDRHRMTAQGKTI